MILVSITYHCFFIILNGNPANVVDQQWDFGSIVSLKPIQFSFSVNLSWYFFFYFFLCVFLFEILLFSTLISFSLHMLLLLLLPVFFAVEFGHKAQKKKEKLEKKQKKAKKSSSSHFAAEIIKKKLVSGCFRCHLSYLSFLFGRLTNLMIPSWKSSTALIWVGETQNPPFRTQRLEQVPALPVTHRPANLQVRWSCKSLGHATIQFATVPVLCIFVRKKEEKESQEGKEERQNQEEQKSILAGHWKFYVITACWKVNSSQLLLLQKMGDSQKSIGTVQKPSYRLWWNVTHPRTRRESDLNIFDAVGASIGWRRGDGGFQGVELHPWRGKLTISRARGVSLAETIGKPIWTLRCWETLAKVHRNAQVLILVASARTGKKRSNHVTMSAFFLVSRTKEVHFKETKLVKWTINPSLETQFSMEFGFISKTICSWLLDVLSVMNLRGSRVHYILSFFFGNFAASICSTQYHIGAILRSKSSVPAPAPLIELVFSHWISRLAYAQKYTILGMWQWDFSMQRYSLHFPVYFSKFWILEILEISTRRS